MADDADAKMAGTKGSSLGYTLYLLKRNPLSLLGVCMIVAFIALALIAPYIVPVNPLDVNPAHQLEPPSRAHLFGTDDTGMDVFSRVVCGTRYDLLIAVASVLLAVVVGVPIGAVAGYFGGVLDEIVMRVLDSMQAFPMFILAIGIITALGQSMLNVILVIAFVNFPTYVRLVRGSMLTVKESQFCEAARCLGNPPSRIIFRHLLPNCLSPVIIQASLNSGWAILTAAGLGFLGLGVRIPTPEWGAMITQGAEYVVSGEWWISFFPGLAIILAVLAFNLLGDSLDDILDPRRR